MRRVWLMAAAAATVLELSSPVAVHSANRAAAHDSATVAGAVTAVSVQRSSGRAEVVIGLTGDVEVDDFSLASPHRIVIDLKGATLKMLPKLYDGIARGGIVNVRVAQFNATDVRVVLDVDRQREYTVARGEGDVRVSFETAEEFEPWILGAGARTPAAKAPAAAPVKPASMVEEPPVAASQRLAPPTAPILQQVGGRISVSFVDTDLRDVLAVFSQVSGRSILTSLTGVKINADLINQPWQIALNAILEAHGLAAVEDVNSRIITVARRADLDARVAREPVISVKVPLNYAKADVLAVTIQSLLSADCGGTQLQVVGGAPPAAGAPPGDPVAAAGAGVGGNASNAGGSAPPPAQQQQQQSNAQQQQLLQGPQPTAICPPRGRVVAEASTNSLVIFEKESQMDSLLAYVRAFDMKPQQVNIKAQIVSINRTNTNRLGISYDLGSQQTFFNTIAPRQIGGAAAPGEFLVTLGGDAYAGVANASRSFKGNLSSISLLYSATIGNFSLTSFLDAMSQEELSDVVASPSVNTVDKKLATLFVGGNTAYLLTPPTAPGAIQAAAPQIASLAAGITLNVTPSISANRMVRLTVLAEQSAVTAISAAGPSTQRRTVTNEVLVRDGETLVIAGLTQEQEKVTRRGIPLLMNLPVIGRLFSENERVITKDDLLILITPHILDDPIPPIPPSGRN